MKIDIAFALDVDAGAWAGNDADTMTTAEVADEVRKHVENVARSLYADQGWLQAKEPALVPQAASKCSGCGLVHEPDNCSEERW